MRKHLVRPIVVTGLLCGAILAVTTIRSDRASADVRSAIAGIQGTTFVGPLSPTNWTMGPLANALIIIKRGDVEIARTRSNAYGRFSIQLAPGMYTVVPRPPMDAAPWPRAIPFNVSVWAGMYASVRVIYDSGIR